MHYVTYCKYDVFITNSICHGSVCACVDREGPCLLVRHTQPN